MHFKQTKFSINNNMQPGSLNKTQTAQDLLSPQMQCIHKRAKSTSRFLFIFAMTSLQWYDKDSFC